MTVRLPSPVAQWNESPDSGAAVALTRTYWHYDVPTTTWTLVSTPALASGALVDDGSASNTFVLMLTAAIPPFTRQLSTVRRGGTDIYVY